MQPFIPALYAALLVQEPALGMPGLPAPLCTCTMHLLGCTGPHKM